MSISAAEATVIAGIVGGGSAVIAATLATIGTYKVTERSVDEIKKEGDRQREADRQQRKLDRQHAWDLAAEDRRQQRIEAAYLQLQTYIAGWSNFAEWRIRIYETDPPTPAPELPNLEARDVALASLQSSAEVDAAVSTFTHQILSFRVHVGDYEYWERMASPYLPGSNEQRRDSRQRLEASASRLIEAGEAAHSRMREELAGWRQGNT
jgi:hypothetical protein